MNNLIKILSLGLLLFGINNCGKKGGSSTPPPASQIIDNANQIQINESGKTVTWSSKTNNIYIQTNDPLCVKGLSAQADDERSKTRFEELSILINSSSISKGARSVADSASVYLSINFNDGSTKTFNLKNDLASTSEDTLSNGQLILDYFSSIKSEIQQSGYVTCNKGKK
jgi:predicted small lipoprotein YifL